MICTNPACSLLFLQRADGPTKCPRCQKKPGAGPVAAGAGVRKSPLPLILAILLLLAVLGGGGWWYMNRESDEVTGPTEPAITITPAKATIPMGGQVEYVVTIMDEEGNAKNATSEAAVIVKNPKIATYDLFHNKAVARSPGSTVLEFHVGEHTSKVTLVVEPPKNPKLVKIEPAKVKLGIGTTAYLKLIGEYEDGRKVDLTKAADWNWDLGQDAPVFVYAGTVEGQKEGQTKLRARYRATPKSDYLIAEADVEVADPQYKSLNLALASPKFAIGQDPGLTVEVETEGGEKYSVLGSALLKLEVSPPELAEVRRQPPYLDTQYTKQPGNGTLTATFRGITKEIPFEIVGSPDKPKTPLAVNPQHLKLAVGEIADVAVSPESSRAETRFASSDLDIVEVTPHNRLIGKKPGQARVTVSRGEKSAQVEVEVAQAAFQGLALEPAEVSVRVDDVVALRAMARLDDDTQVEIDPKLLEWVRFPAGDSLEVNRDALDVRGLKPTGEDFQTLTVKLGEHEATAKIRVIPGPLTLALEPADAVELPVGQKQPLTVYASYGNGEKVEVPADRVEWLADPVDGLTLSQGEVTADKPEAGPLLVKVRYQGQTSNEVQIKSSNYVPVRLTLAANPSELPVGETGQVVLSATKSRRDGGRVGHGRHRVRQQRSEYFGSRSEHGRISRDRPGHGDRDRHARPRPESDGGNRGSANPSHAETRTRQTCQAAGRSAADEGTAADRVAGGRGVCGFAGGSRHRRYAARCHRRLHHQSRKRIGSGRGP